MTGLVRGAGGGAEVSQRIPARCFDALRRGLPPDDRFTAELRELGYDPDAVEPEYPAHLWHRCLELAARRFFSGLSRDRAYRELGQRFARGIVQTPVGSALAAAPFDTPERLLTQIPRYISIGRPDLSVIVQAEGHRRWRLDCTEPEPLPDFMTGLVEGSMRRLGVEPSICAIPSPHADYALTVQW
jgi:uncharacterized protein (TIGR02265 family)